MPAITRSFQTLRLCDTCLHESQHCEFGEILGSEFLFLGFLPLGVVCRGGARIWTGTIRTSPIQT